MYTDALILASDTPVLTNISNFLYTYWLIFMLVGTGIFFTFATKFVQIRHFKDMWKQIFANDGSHHGGISSFQAFATGMASRVGIGNIVGVAIALSLGGPGAIFWMWVVAFVGMATGFVEATLAQIFKVRSEDGSYRGGPAYYIKTGLKSRVGGMIFAGVLIFVYGFAFNMVAANTISGTLQDNHGIAPWVTAIGLVALAAPLMMRGIKPIAKFSAIVMPWIAGFYVLVALIIVFMNIGDVLPIFKLIFEGAFGLNETLAGTGAGIIAAMLNGTKRGLYSNEAGMGSAPNMAATASVSHPVKQGLVQSVGVFIDTMIVCTATAFMIMSSGVFTLENVNSERMAGAELTNSAIVFSFGDWAVWVTTFIIFSMAFTTIFGNYSYAEVNAAYLGIKGRGILVLRIAVLAGIALGATLALSTVWDIADITMALMATLNLISILLLSKWFFGTLKDYEGKIKSGRTDQRFVGHGNPLLPADVPGDVWAQDAVDHKATTA